MQKKKIGILVLGLIILNFSVIYSPNIVYSFFGGEFSTACCWDPGENWCMESGQGRYCPGTGPIDCDESAIDCQLGDCTGNDAMCEDWDEEREEYIWVVYIECPGIE